MQTPQLLCSALLVLAATVACNRTDDANAQRTAEQVKTAATKAGHQLADSWLTTKIQAQYFADDDIKARHINVSTRDGVVTLTGYVDGAPQRELAVQIARTTDGVRHVNDRLTMSDKPAQAVATTGAGPTEAEIGNRANAPPPPNAPDDTQLTGRVQAKLSADDRVKGRPIVVDTRSRIVTLSGEVADEDERARALLLARTTDGVARVEDHLTVAISTPPSSSTATTPPSMSTAPPPLSSPATPRLDDGMLTTMIQAKYFMDPAVKASAIDVSVKDGVVLLQGRVPDEAARKQALAIAGNTEGIVQVIDRLTVAPPKR